MSIAFDTEVLINGAGAAGLTLAIELARRQIAFRLIDKSPAPFNGSRGKGLQPRSLEIFEDMDVLARILAKAGPYPVMRAYSSDGFRDSHAMESRPPSAAEPYSEPLMLPQYLTEASMRERLAEFEHAPEYGCELTGFEQEQAGVTAKIKTLNGEQSLRARYLIGTDGGRSFVRHALNIEFPGETMKVRAVVADLVLEGLSPEYWHRWKDNPATSMALCPLRGTEYFQLQAPVPLEGEPDLSAAGLQKLIAERTGRKDIVVHQVIWASVYSMNARLADSYRKERVFLVGDAAHIHPPTGGQGLNTSLQDAYNLGWKLAAVLSGAPSDLLDSYEAERRPVAAGVLGLSTKLLEAYKANSDVSRGRDTQQLDIVYHDSPLNLALPVREHALRLGDRAPDAPCYDVKKGQPTRLFKQYQGTQWILLGYESAKVPPLREAC